MKRPSISLTFIGGLVTASLVAGCGTTVPRTQRESVGQQGLGGDGSASGATAGGLDGTTGGATGTGSGLGTSGSGTGLTSTPGGGTRSGSAGGSSGVLPSIPPGSGTNTPIKVGVVAVSYAAFAAAFGVSDVNSSSFGTYQAIFAALNKQGGLNGHPIQATYDVVDGGASNASTEADRSCAKFTQDAKVAVVLSMNYTTEEFSSCLAKARTPQIDSGLFAFGDRAMNRHRNLFVPDGMSMDRYMRALLESSAALGRITPKDTLGVLREDCPMHNEVMADTVIPTAKRLGLKVVETTIHCYGGFNQIGSATSEISSAVLKFRSEGVTHVTCMSASEGFCLVVFTKAASNQGYKPKYLMTSNAYPYADSDTSQPVSYSPDQLPGMSAIGWAPFIDVGTRAKATGRQATAQALCHKLDPTYGGHASDTTARENWIAFAYGECDSIFVLKAVAERLGTQLSMPYFPAVYQQVVPGYSAAEPTDGALLFPNGRRDGAARIVPTSWKSSCQCFSVDGPTREAS